MEPPEPQALVPVGTDDAVLRARRWRLVRDLAVFQLKLLVDGIKDLVLSPVSLVAAIVGLVTRREDPGRTFAAVLRFGHGFDRWVNLFNQPGDAGDQPRLPTAHDPHPTAPTHPGDTSSSREGLDAYVARVEQVLVEQYRRGGLTAKAKDAIDQAIDTLHQRGRPPG